MRGRPFVVVGLGLLLCHHLVCYYFRPVSYMLLFNICISLANWCVIIWLPGMPLFGKTFFYYAMTWPDYYQSFDMIGCLLNIIILSCYHLTPSMIYLTCDCHLYGNFDLLSVPWSVTCIPALYAVTWLYSTYVLLISWSCLFPIFPVKW